MADTLWFSNDYNDMSVEWGQDAGFQFEFYCQRCRDTWRSGFDPYKAARAAGWIRRASNMASGAANSLGIDVAEGIDGMVQSGWHKARDRSFQQVDRRRRRALQPLRALLELRVRPLLHRRPRHVPELRAGPGRRGRVGARPRAWSTPPRAAPATSAPRRRWRSTSSPRSSSSASSAGPRPTARSSVPECGHRQVAEGTCGGCSAQVPTGFEVLPGVRAAPVAAPSTDDPRTGGRSGIRSAALVAFWSPCPGMPWQVGLSELDDRLPPGAAGPVPGERLRRALQRHLGLHVDPQGAAVDLLGDRGEQVRTWPRSAG